MPKKKPPQNAEPSPSTVTAAESLDSDLKLMPPEDSGGKTSEKKRSGVFIPFDAEGNVDEKRLRGETWKLDAVKKALLASGSVDAKEVGMDVSPGFVGGLYTAVELAIQRIGTAFLKWPVDLAQGMKYSEAQRALLIPPTQRVIEKFAPAWLVRNQELAEFAVILATETQKMVQGALVGYLQMHPELRRQPEPPPESAAATPEAA